MSSTSRHWPLVLAHRRVARGGTLTDRAGHGSARRPRLGASASARQRGTGPARSALHVGVPGCLRVPGPKPRPPHCASGRCPRRVAGRAGAAWRRRAWGGARSSSRHPRTRRSPRHHGSDARTTWDRRGDPPTDADAAACPPLAPRAARRMARTGRPGSSSARAAAVPALGASLHTDRGSAQMAISRSLTDTHTRRPGAPGAGLVADDWNRDRRPGDPPMSSCILALRCHLCHRCHAGRTDRALLAPRRSSLLGCLASLCAVRSRARHAPRAPRPARPRPRTTDPLTDG